jgi:Glycerophosphoryl diester phosphodiesterase
MIAAAAALFSVAACDNGLDIRGKNPAGSTGGEDRPAVTEPAPCDNKIVAHRGGSSECGMPDNSRGSLKYAMTLKLYASECDIYWTKDNNVVIAHADSEYKINGLLPWENDLATLRKAGTLKNGESLPTLEEFLDIVMVEGNCTKLCLDIKYTLPNEYASKAVSLACEIIKEKGGEKFCEFICTSNATVARTAAGCMNAYGIPVGWMANAAPSDFKGYGFNWANLSAKSYMSPYGARTIDEFLAAGMEISVFNVDKAGSTDGNAVTSDSDVQYYLENYSKLKFICTNYPKWLKSKIN